MDERMSAKARRTCSGRLSGAGRSLLGSGRLVVGFVALSVVAAACSTSTATSPSSLSGYKAGAINRQYAGTTISVLLPPWGQMPKSQLAKFTKATGIKVNLQEMAWDSIHNKVVTSEAAHVAPADITEVDWSWVGQFGTAGWYTPLNKYISPKALSASTVAKIFTLHGQLVAMPYNIDFRAMILNWTDFQRAGITKAPATWSGLLADAKLLKAKGIVNYPIGVPLSITEGASTPWYAYTKAAGGELFSSSFKPLFTATSSPGAQALRFERALYQDHLIPPGEVTMTDVQTDTAFQAGQTAIQLSYTPGALPGDTSPSTSAIAKAHDVVRLVPLPGHNGHATGTFGLPEGLGIPKLAKHKAAAAMFINWWEQTPQLLVSYHNPNMGNLPPERYAMQALVTQHQLIGGSAILSILPSVQPLFPQGTPVWYPQFSHDAATMVQSVVTGKAHAMVALRQLGAQVKTLQQGP